jgi:hypothetical protein
MNVNTVMNRIVEQRWLMYLALFLSIFLVQYCFAAGDTDVLSKTGVTGKVEGTFGPSSFFAWAIYILEFVVGMYKYATGGKNPMVLVGIVVLIIASAAGFSLIGTAPAGGS